MFRDARSDKYADHLTNELVRPDKREGATAKGGAERGPELGPQGPSAAQFHRGREAFYAFHGKEVQVAVDLKIRKFPDVYRDLDLRYAVVEQVGREVHRKHAEDGCTSIVALAVRCAKLRSIDMVERVIKPRRDAELGIEGHAFDVLAYESGLTDDDDEMTAAVGPSDDEEILAERLLMLDEFTEALPARHAEALALMLAMAREHDRVDDDVIAAQLEATRKTTGQKPVDAGDVQSFRYDIRLRLAATRLVIAGGVLTDATAVERLAILVRRWMDGDPLSEIGKTQLGVAKKLAKFLQARGI